MRRKDEISICSRYVYRAQWHHPTQSDILAEQTEAVSSSPEESW